MRTIRPIALVALAGLVGLGCVAAPRPAPQPLSATSGDVTCHNVTSGRKTQVYCGDPEQWRELDRRVALLNAGITCRDARTPRERCMSAAEWQRLDRAANEFAQAAAMGSEAQNGVARAYAGVEQMRMMWTQATGLPYPNLPPPTPRP